MLHLLVGMYTTSLIYSLAIEEGTDLSQRAIKRKRIIRKYAYQGKTHGRLRRNAVTTNRNFLV